MGLQQAYITHLLRYVGVGLISGSIVHAGTLGGNWLRYIVLIALGAAMFAFGVWLEHRLEHRDNIGLYTALSVAVSIGTGMVSGATQHYLDGPFIAAFLLPSGLLIGYLAFAYRDHRTELNTKRIAWLLFVAVATALVLWLTANWLGELVPHGH